MINRCYSWVSKTANRFHRQRQTRQDARTQPAAEGGAAHLVQQLSTGIARAPRSLASSRVPPRQPVEQPQPQPACSRTPSSRASCPSCTALAASLSNSRSVFFDQEPSFLKKWGFWVINRPTTAAAPVTKIVNASRLFRFLAEQ